MKMSKNIKTPNLSKGSKFGYLRLIEVLGIIIVVAGIGVISHVTVNVLKEEAGKLGELEKESVVLRQKIKEAKTNLTKRNDSDDKTQAVVDNLNSFRERFLRDPEKGRIFVISEINNLVKKNNLKLTNGINFEKLEELTEVEDKDGKKTKSSTSRRVTKKEKPTFYPGLSSSFAVAGKYDSFRKFLYELENSKMFFVVENINLQMPDLEPKASSNAYPERVSTAQRLSQGVNEFTVQMQVTAYFRRMENSVNE